MKFSLRSWVLMMLVITQAASVIGAGQGKSQVKVGVAVMSANGTRAVNGELQRDRLIRLFRPDKKKQQSARDVEIVAVPLNASSADDLSNEAREKACDYVLYTTLMEASAQNTLQEPPRPIGVGFAADPLSAAPDTRKTQPETWHAVVQFKLVREGDPTPRLIGTSNMFVGSDEMSAVTATLQTIANRVKAAISAPEPVLSH